MDAFAVDRVGHVAEVTLLGPGKGNAMGEAFWRELPVVFGSLDADDEVRAVVLTGSADHFSVGLDLHEMMPRWVEALGPGAGARARARTDFLGEIRRLQSAVTSVAQCRKPVIAAVSGWCLGGGVDLISAADIRLASAGATFGVRETKVAIVADVGSLQRLAGVIGEGHLRELALTGNDIDATEAVRIGLVNRVLDTHDDLLASAREMATSIAANAPLAVQGVKQVLNEEREHRISAGLRHVSTWNAAFLPSADLNEAMAAFAQHRRPDFRGN